MALQRDGGDGCDKSMSDLTSQLASEKERRKKLNSDILAMKTELARFAQELSAKDVQAEALEFNLSAQSDETKVTTALLQARESALQSVLTELRHVQFARDCCSGDLDEVTNQLTATGKDLEAAQAEVAKLAADGASQLRGLKELGTKLEREKLLRSEAERAAEAAIRAADELSERLAGQQDTTQLLENELTALRSSLDRAHRELQDVQQRAASEANNFATQLASVQKDWESRFGYAEDREMLLVKRAEAAEAAHVKLANELNASRMQLQSVEAALKQASEITASLSSGQTEHHYGAANQMAHQQHILMPAKQVCYEGMAAFCDSRGAVCETTAHVSHQYDHVIHTDTALSTTIYTLELQLDQARKDTETAKAFGRSLLSSNRALNAEVVRLRRQCSA